MEDVHTFAERLVKYFEWHTSKNSTKRMLKGAKAAREWLRLLDAEEVSEAEISALIGMTCANMDEGSNWSDLAVGTYHWATSKGYKLPPRDVYFNSQTMSQSDDSRFTPVQRANWLIEHFENNRRDDPDDDVWLNGRSIATEWRRLIDTQNLNRSEVFSLVQRLPEQERNNSTSLGYYLSQGIYDWCSSIGYRDLVPRHWHELVRRSR